MSTRDEHSGDVRSRFLFWTEDNRLHTVADDRHYSYYAYDHAGERTMKLTGASTLLDVNADHMNTHADLTEATLYPSPYMVVSNHGYTKHYYAGAERIAARIGGGGLDHDRECIVEDGEAAGRVDKLFWNCLEQVNSTEIEHQNLQELDIVDIDGNPMEAAQRFDIDNMPSGLKCNAMPAVDWLHGMIQHFSQSHPPAEEPDVYFYHSDHLGSASWITDADGTPVQHLQYLPYGEPFVNQRVSDYSERFTFTGKERDEETGYGYFGARYMDYELMTMWLSVDPMADKYPGISPYNYCVWNPIKLVDPDGNEAWKPDENRNLVAEKGDNAWTLAAYLNTTPEIATNMLGEQGYSVNSKGVLNLREGDVFKIDYGTTENHSDKDLGKTGNYIRERAGSGIAKDLFANFWNGDGDIQLTGSQFAGILMYIKESNQSPTESDSKSKLINFYDSQEYSLAYGRATVTIDNRQRITGFNDTYDFDTKKLGQRKLINEIKTRAVAASSNFMGNGKGFKISYP